MVTKRLLKYHGDGFARPSRCFSGSSHRGKAIHEECPLVWWRARSGIMDRFLACRQWSDRGVQPLEVFQHRDTALDMFVLTLGGIRWIHLSELIVEIGSWAQLSVGCVVRRYDSRSPSQPKPSSVRGKHPIVLEAAWANNPGQSGQPSYRQSGFPKSNILSNLHPCSTFTLPAPLNPSGSTSSGGPFGEPVVIR